MAAQLGVAGLADQDVRAAVAPGEGERSGVEIALVGNGVMGVTEDDEACPRELPNPGRAFAEASFGERAVAIVSAQGGTRKVREAPECERRGERPPWNRRDA